MYHIIHWTSKELVKSLDKVGEIELANKFRNISLNKAGEEFHRAYCAYRADLADRAYRADAYRADRAYLAYCAYRADRVKEFVEAYIYAGGKLKNLKKAKLNAVTLKNIEKGALKQSDWHHGAICGTTHCRGGWYIFSLKDVGKELDELVGSEMAASMIALINMNEIPDFHNIDNKAVLDDIKAWAKKER